jgi:hypothetical protein
VPGDGRRLTCLLVALAACLPVRRPSVTLAPGAALGSYQVFDVGPVIDETGYPFPSGITDSLRSRLVRRLREKGFIVASRDSASGAVLRIESRLTAFRSGGISLSLGGPGSTRCGLTSALIDGTSGRWLGEIRAAEDESLTPFTVLMTCARMVADEIGRRVRVRGAG